MNYVVKVKELLHITQQKTNELNGWMRTAYAVPTVNDATIEASIKSFYTQLITSNSVEILDYQYKFFKQSTDKAIKGTPPFFTDNKEEFRDSIIWSIVCDFVNRNPEAKSYLVTKNFNDFWNKENTDLHENLRAECPAIGVVDGLKKLFEIETHLINYKRRIEFQQWLEKQDITEFSIGQAIKSSLWYPLFTLVDEKIKRYPIKELFFPYDLGFIIPELKKDQLEIDCITTSTPVEDFALLEVVANLPFTGKLYYPNVHQGDFSNKYKL